MISEMKMKNVILAITVIFAALSCTRQPADSKGTIVLEISAGKTKADVAGIDLGSFNILVSGVTYHTGEPWSATLKYSEFGGNMEVPYGVYDISAESCTPEDAEDGDGCVRYAGTRESLDVYSDKPRHAKIVCAIANAAVRVVFDESFMEVFDDGSVMISDGVRAFEISIAQSAERTVWYNVEGGTKSLGYTVKGTIDGVNKEYGGTLTLSAAQEGIILIKSGKDGFFKPQISVDDIYEDNDMMEILDPETE